MAVYYVNNGETLYSIARANNTTVPELLRLNPSVKNNVIYPKQKLTLPDVNAGLDIVTLEKTATETPPVNQTGQETYTIKRGDNFAKIETDYWLKPGQIQAANPKVNPKSLKPGQIINLPKKEYYINPVDQNDEKFKLFLLNILKYEGTYRPAKKDGSDVKTNYGITQNIYDRYLKDKAFDNKKSFTQTKDIKNITTNEIKEIYYNYYYLASGADKEQDKKTAYWLMDTAVNCGVKKAKELRKTCGTDNKKWYEARKDNYNKIALFNHKKAKFLPGWLSRIEEIKNHVIT